VPCSQEIVVWWSDVCAVVCCSALQRVPATHCSETGYICRTWAGGCVVVLQCVAVCCSVLQCVAVCRTWAGGSTFKGSSLHALERSNLRFDAASPTSYTATHISTCRSMSGSLLFDMLKHWVGVLRVTGNDILKSQLDSYFPQTIW